MSAALESLPCSLEVRESQTEDVKRDPLRWILPEEERPELDRLRELAGVVEGERSHGEAIESDWFVDAVGTSLTPADALSVPFQCLRVFFSIPLDARVLLLGASAEDEHRRTVSAHLSSKLTRLNMIRWLQNIPMQQLGNSFLRVIDSTSAVFLETFLVPRTQRAPENRTEEEKERAHEFPAGMKFPQPNETYNTPPSRIDCLKMEGRPKMKSVQPPPPTQPSPSVSEAAAACSTPVHGSSRSLPEPVFSVGERSVVAFSKLTLMAFVTQCKRADETGQEGGESRDESSPEVTSRDRKAFTFLHGLMNWRPRSDGCLLSLLCSTAIKTIVRHGLQETAVVVETNKDVEMEPAAAQDAESASPTHLAPAAAAAAAGRSSSARTAPTLSLKGAWEAVSQPLKYLVRNLVDWWSPLCETEGSISESALHARFASLTNDDEFREALMERLPYKVHIQGI
uniref:Uncharacterized protein n=1 Tax=Chromera velia CCMP2878 TaxID=1169474 RepID=A0A0G4HHG3_9ALVE|eukprot:Cvel_27486.t1-p1 / transcript=Cvel_27486.t1 / gene=Cvel_27486 / organism=Chromera_velia_CCMP2878 / gene_product=hypothetical protein / transcript_product=hypothetical protein / location=Cvel_scaffold3437:3838-5199(+) / protein_length=454 / sequence_SO=supercontig / SO=protein_coding / is_pseudo=false